MVAPVKIAHIVFRTRRFEEMIAWYETVFDAKIQHQDPVIAFLTFDEEHHRIAFINLSVVEPGTNEPDVRHASGVDHVAFTYADLPALMHTYHRLKEAGTTPYWPIHHGLTISFYYKDPDGNRIEFQAECFKTMAEGTAFMKSGAFENNSIGVNFDANEFAERYEAGTPIHELLHMPDGPPATLPPEHGIGTS